MKTTLSTFWRGVNKPTACIQMIDCIQSFWKYIFYDKHGMISTSLFSIQFGWSICLHSAQKADGANASQHEYVIVIPAVYSKQMKRPDVSHNT